MAQRNRLFHPRNTLRAGLLLVCVASALAFGQDTDALGNATGFTEAAPPLPSVKTGSGQTWTAANVVHDMAQVVTASMAQLQANAQLESLGPMLSGFFLLLLLVWTSVKAMASGRGFGELLGDWIPIFVSFGVVTLFLDRSAGALIVSSMNNIAGAISGGRMDTLAHALQTGAEPIVKAVAAVVQMPRASSATPVTAAEGWLAVMGAGFVSFIIAAIAKVMTAIILLGAAAVVVANLVMSFVSVQLVLLLAPLMVPFLMFKPMAWLFDSWLRFLLGACMLKIVMAFLLRVAEQMLGHISTYAAALQAEAAASEQMPALMVDMMLFGVILMLTLLVTLLIHQAHAIANGLLSGQSGSAGFSGMRAVTQSVGMRGANAVATRALKPLKP